MEKICKELFKSNFELLNSIGYRQNEIDNRDDEN